MEKYSDKGSPHFQKTGEINDNSPYGKICPETLKEMRECLVTEWCTDTKQKELINMCEEVLLTPASNLTKARQTLSFCDGTNQPGRWEFFVLTKTLENNLPKFVLVNTLRSYCTAISRLFELETVEIPKYLQNFQDKREYRVIWKSVKQSDFRLIACSISTILKTGERGKSKRRMIATHNMFARPFIMISENLVMKMLEHEKYSVIQLGGEVKKQRMTTLVEDVMHKSAFFIISGDNTKWNECLNPKAMGSLLRSIFEMENRSLDFPESTHSMFTIMGQIITMAYGFFAKKNILLGKGISMRTKDKKYSFHVPCNNVTNATNEYKKIMENIDPEKFLDIPFPFAKEEKQAYFCEAGMLMGSFNGGSTLYAICAFRTSIKHVARIIGKTVTVDIRESSDDFELTAYHNDPEDPEQIQKEELLKAIEIVRRTVKTAGINWSPEKSIMGYNSLIGELTSRYHTYRHYGNISVDLPGITPQGLDPYTDVGLFVNFIRASMAKQGMENTTADHAIDLFFRIYNRTYDLLEGSTTTELNKMIKEKYKCENTIYANGGPNVYSISTLGIPELALRADPLMQLDPARVEPRMQPRYLAAIMNPNSPMSAVREEIDMYVDGRKPTIEEDGLPSCIYKFRMRKNETTQNRGGMLAFEREARAICNKIMKADQTFPLTAPRGLSTCGEMVYFKMKEKLEMIAESNPILAEEYRL